MKKIAPTGPANADIMLVGEAPGSSEEKLGVPFIGSSGKELTKMLSEVGINRDDCFITNVCKYRPPNNQIDAWFPKKTQAKKFGISEFNGRYPHENIVEGIFDLYNELQMVRPKVVIAFGDTALWALTGESGISKWRGSYLNLNMDYLLNNLEFQVKFQSIYGYPPEPLNILVIPVYHPAAIMRMWSWRFITIHDLRKAKAASISLPIEPKYNFIVRPSFEQVMEKLNELYSLAEKETLRLGADIETRQRHIACIGLAWSRVDAICIPIMDINHPAGYFTVEETTQIVWLLAKLLLHKNVQVIGQNWLYDMQYIAKEWGFLPLPFLDTMIAHHTCFPGLQKGLDFLSSLYCEYHRYWKDEGKQWDPRYVDEEQLWVYNCKDCVTTLEASYAIERTIEKMNMQDQVAFQMSMVRPVMRTMLRGVRTDSTWRSNTAMYLTEQMIQRSEFLNYVLQCEFNPRSAPQMKKLFYDKLGVPPVLHKKTRQPTLDKNALGDLRKKADPILYPVIDAIIAFRRAGTSYSVATVKLDRDQRFRTSYAITGTETFRLSSSEDAFGFGTNGQNISKGDE